jgi:hypothetical protein
MLAVGIEQAVHLSQHLSSLFDGVAYCQCDVKHGHSISLLLLQGEGCVIRGSNRHTHPLDPPG